MQLPRRQYVPILTPRSVAPDFASLALENQILSKLQFQNSALKLYYSLCYNSHLKTKVGEYYVHSKIKWPC